MEKRERGRDRRKAENALLRELVDALKRFIAARDAIWGLDLFDRLFRRRKCEEVFARYEEAAAIVKKNIREMAAMRSRQPGGFTQKEPLVSFEEFEILMDTAPPRSAGKNRAGDGGHGKRADTVSRPGPGVSSVPAGDAEDTRENKE